MGDSSMNKVTVILGYAADIEHDDTKVLKAYKMVKLF